MMKGRKNIHPQEFWEKYALFFRVINGNTKKKKKCGKLYVYLRHGYTDAKCNP